MEASEYCSKVCGAKCCYSKPPDEHDVVRCGRLGANNLCSVYDARYNADSPDVVIVGYYRSSKYKDLAGDAALRPFYCGRIADLIKNKLLHEDVIAQCCFAHPELLEDKHENITS